MRIDIFTPFIPMLNRRDAIRLIAFEFRKHDVNCLRRAINAIRSNYRCADPMPGC